MSYSRSRRIGQLACGVLTSAFLLQSVAAQDQTDPWQPLFDGKTLEGWEGDTKYWSVRDGAIRGDIPEGQSLNHNTWLVWRGAPLKNFELRLQFKLSGLPAANSGIQFRCQVDSINHVSGYQADLDLGQTWLGRIYDEHGRALLVERGQRVKIDPEGKREIDTFANKDLYPALFREGEWNDYRIIASDHHMSVEVNGTLFTELIDLQEGETDLQGGLAFQLHSGPETHVAFRNIRIREIGAEAHRVKFRKQTVQAEEPSGRFPTHDDGTPVNTGFETGTLKDWTAKDKAFTDQPVNTNGIAKRWPGQTSNKVGTYFIGGYEHHQDAPTGTLESVPFKVTAPYASFLVGGGSGESTRVEILLAKRNDEVLFSGHGANREQMDRVIVDLRKHQGESIKIRLVDQNPGGWGHLNFDDFRFHDQAPKNLITRAKSRKEENPLLHHLVPNEPAGTALNQAALDTTRKMSVEPGFQVDLVAAEPTIHQPIAFTFDDRGRIWVVEAMSYPAKRPAGEGQDRIVILSDEDHDGTFERSHVFVEGLNLVSALEVGFGGVWVGAAPELLFIPDADQDDQPDGPAQVLLDGFGYQDTHETLNNFIWGPDGWLYGNQGVFNTSQIGQPGSDDRTALSAGVWRYHPVRHEFEVFAHGGSNQWGLDYDDLGEWFMTQCRSYWGKGSTTHIIQGGHYWTQTNRGYADFVFADQPAGNEFYRNYLLASARYGHGEGGAGKPGSRDLYGGHSHVGTMLYLGDNWPEGYRNHLYTHNLHGHQINRQINLPEGAGFNTVHAGQDFLYCEDPLYVAVDLKAGPDGAVYVSDWYDRQHCHNPNTELWDRGNGRLYRIAWRATYQPRAVNLRSLSDLQLAAMVTHPNDWHVRTARRLLQERATQRPIATTAIAHLRRTSVGHDEPARRLRAAWGLFASQAANDTDYQTWLRDAHPSVRAWAVQLVAENGSVSAPVAHSLVSIAKADASPLVGRYVASAAQRLTPALGWALMEELVQRSDWRQDRVLPKLIWYSYAELMNQDLERGLNLASKIELDPIPDFVRTYAANRSSRGVEQALAQLNPNNARRILEGLVIALKSETSYPQPQAWNEHGLRFYHHPDTRVRQLATLLGAKFQDQRLTPRLTRTVRDRSQSPDARRNAFKLLLNTDPQGTVELAQALLSDSALRGVALSALSRFDHPASAPAILNVWNTLSRPEQKEALVTMTRRVSLARPLLEAVAKERLDRGQLTAFHIRQIMNLGDPELTRQLENIWGEIHTSSTEVAQQIEQLTKTYHEAPLWAYSASAGKRHFEMLCQTCHQPNDRSPLGPNLSGAGSNGAQYFIENIMAPNAVVGLDYQQTIIETKDGEYVSGLLIENSDSSVLLQTVSEQVRIPRARIAEQTTTDLSLMPEGLLQSLNDREQIELLKYLTGL